MDPATLAATATALLSPYLGKVADKAAETLGEKLPGAAGKLWGALTERLKGKPAAEEAAKDLVARPEDVDNQASFRKEVRKALEADPAFAAEFAELLAHAQKAVGPTIVNTGSGAVVTGGGVAAGAGGVAIGGSVHGDVVTGSKTTVFDQRGSSVGQQVNVAGNRAAGLAKSKDEGG